MSKPTPLATISDLGGHFAKMRGKLTICLLLAFALLPRAAAKANLTNKRNSKLWNVAASVFVFVVLLSTTASSQTRVEDAIKLSQLTLSAMVCANYTDDTKEANRLFDLGIDSGKKFIQTWNNMSDEERKAARPNVSVLWGAVQGYSVDFILGQVWNEMTKDAYRFLGDDTKQWQYKRPLEYSNRNCNILR